jgi:hypothetical protein
VRFDEDEALAAFEIVGLFLWKFTVYEPMYWISCLCRFVDRAAYAVVRSTAPDGVRDLFDEANDE